jgi:hypothetical protein
LEEENNIKKENREVQREERNFQHRILIYNILIFFMLRIISLDEVRRRKYFDWSQGRKCSTSRRNLL